MNCCRRWLVFFIRGRLETSSISSVYRSGGIDGERIERWGGTSSTIKTKYGVLLSRIWNVRMYNNLDLRDWTILNDRTMNFSTSAAFFLSAETDE